MSRKVKVMTPAARRRAQKRELKKEMARVAEFVFREVRAGLAVLDEPLPGADQGVVIEGRIVGDAIITEAETD
jgi:hypothetical protein